MKISRDIKEQILAEKDRLSINQISKKYNLPRIEIKNIIKASSKKNPKWFFAVLILLPIIFLIGIEILLKIIDYGYNLDQWVDAGQEKYIINPNIGRRYFTSGDFNPNTVEDVFDQHKKTNAFRVFVLGGSSAEGYPYNPLGSFSRYIRRRLELVYPNSTIEIVNISMTAVNSYTVLDLLPGVLDQKPDLILIYAGHNEYYGALGVGSVQSYGSSRTLIKVMLYLNSFKITQLVRNSINWIAALFGSENNGTSGTLMSRMAKDKYILLNSEVYNAGLHQFKQNFTDILHLTKETGVPVILGRLVSNLKDQRPFISVNTPGYKTADQVYEEAENELKNNNFTNADSLFRLAKDLDALRFRAPEKMNKIIDNLGIEFQVATIPIDSIFELESSDGIVGDNLIVDHLHPNVQGYQLIGKAFYDCMNKQGYLPKTENAKIKFSEQDSLTRANFMFTKLDSVMGNDFVKLLKIDWPYVKKRVAISEFKPKDFLNLFKPNNAIDSIAMYRIENRISWIDAHFMAATFYLKKDNIKEYLKYINVMIYQYPGLRNLDTILKYFYERNKLDLADYTPKRNGLLALYIGNFNNAIKYLDEANKSKPNDPLVLYNLALAYSKKKDFDQALILINKCLTVNPNYTEANKLKQQIVNQLKIN
ncbi:tetratricopeptide repeat protein [bacterium BMS3Abin03]|nr:tetratricopeptide repeat protein [bacterium BMS3Abin03]MCG6960454.1 tetratricopeptide repeat protein [bacterium BMS3Abin03]